MAFTVSKIDHIGVACKDLDISKKFYTDILGLECTGEEAVPSQGVKTVFIKCGPNLIELLVDITENNDGPIGKYIAKNGQGIQHVALLVDDLVAAIADVQAKGGVMIDKAPRGGAGGMAGRFAERQSRFPDLDPQGRQMRRLYPHAAGRHGRQAGRRWRHACQP